MSLYDELHALVDALNNSGAEHAICGGIALAIHGFPRFTRDIDLLIPPASLPAVVDIATRLGFVEMKTLAGRPQDRADLARLGGTDDRNV